MIWKVGEERGERERVNRKRSLKRERGEGKGDRGRGREWDTSVLDILYVPVLYITFNLTFLCITTYIIHYV